MAKQVTRTDLSSPDIDDETSSSSDNQQEQPSNVASKKDSIKNYVTNVLHRHGRDDQQQTNVGPSQIEIDTGTANTRHGYENISAFRQYHFNPEGAVKTDAQRRNQEGYTSDDDDDDLMGHTSTGQTGDFDDSLGELNLDLNPIVEQRESAEQVYKQKVYLRQLQPPTPPSVEIQVQEVLLQPQQPKPPLHVRVAKPEPRTPSPIIIKNAPPQPPPIEPDQPIIYNKYVPPPKQPPQQIIIHRYPELPPKPRPIIVEQWLPYKQAPKRIIKHSLPPEALQTPPPPHNLLLSYAKPRALIEVELVRLPVVKIDPFTYQQMSSGNPQQLAQYPPFQHERDYLSRDTLTRAAHLSDQVKWRI